jgi:caffeoyl-CoA O-methyltransferase
MSNRTLNLDDVLHRYLLDHTLREHAQQTALRQATRDHPRGGMQISPEQGALMQLLVKLMGARRTLEIGVFTGYSALTVALALPWDGHVLACDISAEYTAIGLPFWERAGVAGKIELVLGPAIAIDNVLWSGRVARAVDPGQDPDTAALRRLNAKLHIDERVDLAMVPIGDGLTLARKR